MNLNKIKVNNIIFSNKKDISEIMAAQFLANFLDKKNKSELDESVLLTTNNLINYNNIITTFSKSNLADNPADAKTFSNEAEIF